MRPLDLPVIARQVTARVIATAEKEGGYGNVDVSLVQARIVDLPSSPYADAVTSAKSLLRALENNELAAIRTGAQRLRDSLGGSGAVAVIAARPVAANNNTTVDRASQLELQTELQLIEDLLTGSEAERREGLDKLHQLIRRLR